MVLELSHSEHDKDYEDDEDAVQRLLRRTKTKLGLGQNNTPKIVDLASKAFILGVVRRENNMLVVYDGQQLSARMFIL